MHKYLQSLTRKLAEDRGFTVSVEKRVLDGHGHVDVYLERDGVTIGCEISVTTSAAHEAQNLAKCLAAGLGHAILISADENCLTEARELLKDAPAGRAHCLTPDAFIDFLDGLESSGPQRPSKRPQATSAEQPGSAKRMLVAEDAAEYLGLAVQTLAKMRWSGESPPFFKVGRRVLYDREELDAWLSGRRRTSTSDAGTS